MYVKQTIPDALLSCADAPVLPDPITDFAIANLLIDYDAALTDCKSKLQKIKELTDE